MAKQKIHGPYSVVTALKLGDSGIWEVMYQNSPQGDRRELRPRKTYTHRTAAYRHAVTLNKQWQEECTDWRELAKWGFINDHVLEMQALEATLEKFLASDDLMDGCIKSTKASWGGSGYSVELFTDGTWRVLWNNEIGNLYQSPGIILGLPTLDDEDMNEYVNGGAGDEDDFFFFQFESEQDEIKKELRDSL